MYLKSLSCLNRVNKFKSMFSKFIKNNTQNKKISSTLLNLVLSFFVVIIVSTGFIALFSYEFLYKNMETQTIKSNSELLNQFKKSVDNYILRNIDKICLSVLQDTEDNNDIMYFFSNPVKGNVTGINKVYTYLRSLKSLNPLLDSISVYYKTNDIIISSNGMKYLSLPNKPDWIDTEWINTLSSLKTNYIWEDTRRVSNPKGLEYPEKVHKNIVTFVRKYPLSSSANSLRGGIAVTISESVLYNTIKDSAPIDFGQIFIINDQGTIISHSDEKYLFSNINDLLDDTTLSDHYTNNGYFITKVEDKKSVVSYAISEYNNWTYVAVKPVFRISEGYKYLDKIIIFIAVFTLLIGILLMLISAKKFYLPLKNLVRTSRSIMSSPQSETIKDEYAFISTALSSLAFKIKEQEDKLDENLPILKHHFLLDFLSGNYYSSEEVYTKLKLLKVEFPYSFFSIIMLKLIKSPSMDLSTFEYSKIKIIEDLEKSYNKKVYSKEHSDIRFLCTETNNKILITANININTIDIKNLVKAICNSIREDYGMRINAAIGSTCNSIFNITKSYNEAQTCLKYCYLYPDQEIFLPYDVDNWELKTNELDKHMLDAFSHNLANQDKTNTLSSFKDIILSLKNGQYSYDYTINYLYNILAYIAEAIKKIKLNNTLLSDMDVYTHFNKITSIDEFETWISSIIEQILAYSDDWQNIRNKEIVAKVKDYIKTNVINKDISLNSVSDAFYLSPNYLSKIFKEETNIYFIDYLIEARLEMSKELLISGKLSVEEISSVIGYSSSQYFIRKFKSRYGKTPKQYQIENAIS